MGLLIRLSIRWRVVTVLVAALVIALGFWAVMRLQIELLPDIDFPLITVTTAYPGPDPQHVLEEVTIPVEEALFGLDGVENVQSVTSPGFSLALAEFDFGTDMKEVAGILERRTGDLSLPPDAGAPRVLRANPDEFPVLQLSVSRPGDMEELKALVQSGVAPAIEDTPGVFSASVPSSAIAGLSITRTNGEPSLAISVTKEPEANTVEVADAVMGRLEDGAGLLPADADVTVVFNQATDIKGSIESLQREATLGALFAVVVIFVFLLSVRPTFVTSVSIPVSILGGLIIMYLQGMSLNILTLGGLTIAVGRVVDDSIVVMENVYRHVQTGEERRSAALNATREVAGAIATSTFTTIAVFAPLGFMSGIIGAFFFPFALTVTYALLASLVVALTVVPALASIFIGHTDAAVERESLLQRVYGTTLQWALQHKLATLMVALLALIGSFALLPVIPKTFLPGGDENLLNASVTMLQQVELDEMLAPGGPVPEIEGVLEELRKEGTVDNYQVTVGTSAGSFGPEGGLSGAPNQVGLFVELSEDAEGREVADFLRHTLRGNDRSVTVSAVQFGGPSSNTMELVLTGDDYPVVVGTAQRIVEALQDVEGLVNVSSDAAANGSLGGLTRISRVNGEQAVTISGTITAANTQAVNQAVTRRVNTIEFPSGVELQTGGVFADIQDAFRQMAIAMAIGVALVYIVMVVTLRSLMNPFVIILSLPLASVGALAALALTQRTLGLPALIGLLMLIGLVVTNAIVLIVFVEQLRRRGLRVYEALVEGGRTRLRPILMTAFTTSFALAPLAVVASKGTLIGAELATVVIGGLMTSTFLTLVVIPVVYRLLRRDRRGPHTPMLSGRHGV